MSETSKNRDLKKITTIFILIVTLMVCETGATYAYFAISASSANTITGTAAAGGLALQLGNSANTTSGTPSLVSPTGTYASKPLVPQYAYKSNTNVLQKAVTGVHPASESGTTVFPCVDANGNAICRIYTFTVRNNATATAVVNGRIYFAGAPTNLRWALMTSATAVTVSGTTAATNFRTPQTSANCTASTATTGTNANNCWFAVDKSLNPSGGASSTSAASGSYQQYWVVMWINETGAVQTDSGSWTASIEFTSSNGTGITSTITS